MTTHSALRNDIVGVALAEAGTLKKIHDISFACTLLVETVLVLLQSDCAPKDNLIAASGKPIIRIVKNDLHCRTEPE